MRKFILPILIFPIILVSCEEKEKPLTKSEIKFKADSIANSKMADLKAQAAEDLDKRRAIEVKAKADSIVAATIAPPAPPKDTTKQIKDTIRQVHDTNNMVR